MRWAGAVLSNIPLRFLRLPVVLDRRGRSRDSHYKDIREGLFTEPVHISKQSVGWPEYEVEALQRARLAGKSEDEIKQLVIQLHAKRQD